MNQCFQYVHGRLPRCLGEARLECLVTSPNKVIQWGATWACTSAQALGDSGICRSQIKYGFSWALIGFNQMELVGSTESTNQQLTLPPPPPYSTQWRTQRRNLTVNLLRPTSSSAASSFGLRRWSWTSYALRRCVASSFGLRRQPRASSFVCYHMQHLPFAYICWSRASSTQCHRVKILFSALCSLCRQLALFRHCYSPP